MDKLLSYRSSIMGCSIVWIMLFHVPGYVDSFWLIDFVRKTGYAGVDIFFLLSGISISLSLNKNTHGSVFSFYKKRAKKIVPAFFIVCFVYQLSVFFIADDNDFMYKLVMAMSGLDFWYLGSSPYWFIPAIMLLYVISPFVIQFFGTGRSLWWLVLSYVFGLALVILFFEHILVFYTRIPIYFFGMYLGFGRNTSILSNGTLFSLAAIGGVVFLIVFFKTNDALRWDYGLWWYPTQLLSIPLAFVIAFLLEKTSVFIVLFDLIGKYTLEIYLIHVYVYKVYGLVVDKNGIIDPAFDFIVLTSLSVILSVLLGKLINPEARHA